MAEDTFFDEDEEMVFVQRDPEQPFKRTDETPFIRKIQRLIEQPAGTEGMVKVMTGEIKRNAKQFNGRGKNELAEAKMYQRIANELGHGLDVGYRHLTDGTTILRLSIRPKRQFTQEQQANREKGQNKRRLQLAQARVAKATGLLRANPEDAEAKAMLAEGQARVKELTPKVNGSKPKPQAK